MATSAEPHATKESIEKVLKEFQTKVRWERGERGGWREVLALMGEPERHGAMRCERARERLKRLSTVKLLEVLLKCQPQLRSTK